MHKNSTMDLTQGNITKQLLIFALPILVGQIFQNLYNSVDAIVVGNAVGTTALAAVSASADIAQLLIGFFTGLSTGAGVLFSRCFGAGDKKKLHDSIHTALTFSLIIGVAMAAGGILLAKQLLYIVGCPDDVFAEALLYLRVYLIGILFTAIYNVGAGILRAVGDSKSPFYYLVIASCINIVLDVLLVVILPLGVMGAALATIGSQLISVLLVFRQMLKTNDVYKLIIKDLKMDKALLLEIMDLGLPAAIQASLISISNLFVNRYINSFGSTAMAGIGAAKKIDRFVGMVAQSMGLATATFVGQNYGAGKIRRIFQGIRACMLMCFSYTVVVSAFIYIFSTDAIRIFISDTDAIAYGVSMLKTMMPLYIFQTFNSILPNAVRGFGKSRAVMFCSVFGMIICRQIFLAIAMSIEHNVVFVYLGFPLGWFFASLLAGIYYFVVIRSKYKEEARISLPWRKAKV